MPRQHPRLQALPAREAVRELNAPYTTVNGLTFLLTGGVVGNDVAPLSPLVGGGNNGVVGVSRYRTGVFGVSYNTFNYGAGTHVNTFGAIPAMAGLDVGPHGD